MYIFSCEFHVVKLNKKTHAPAKSCEFVDCKSILSIIISSHNNITLKIT
nr:MAG TPA: hypothetical protein [Bacteriophage sp.]